MDGKKCFYFQLKRRPPRMGKLLEVLSGLRPYEICCPDVSAAIEYCRERIVGMSVEDYEEWFMVNFPTVTRPKTAPAAVSSERQKKAQNANRFSRSWNNRKWNRDNWIKNVTFYIWPVVVITFTSSAVCDAYQGTFLRDFPEILKCLLQNLKAMQPRYYMM